MARQFTDWTLFFSVLLMTCFGLIMVYSATSISTAIRGGNMEEPFLRQLGAALVSFFILMYLCLLYTSDAADE